MVQGSSYFLLYCLPPVCALYHVLYIYTVSVFVILCLPIVCLCNVCFILAVTGTADGD